MREVEQMEQLSKKAKLARSINYFLDECFGDVQVLNRGDVCIVKQNLLANQDGTFYVQVTSDSEGKTKISPDSKLINISQNTEVIYIKPADEEGRPSGSGYFTCDTYQLILKLSSVVKPNA